MVVIVINNIHVHLQFSILHILLHLLFSLLLDVLIPNLYIDHMASQGAKHTRRSV